MSLSLLCQDLQLFLILLPHWIFLLLEAPHQDYMRRENEVEPGRYPDPCSLPVNPALPAVKALYDALVLELQRQLNGDVLGMGAGSPEFRSKNSV